MTSIEPFLRWVAAPRVPGLALRGRRCASVRRRASWVALLLGATLAAPAGSQPAANLAAGASPRAASTALDIKTRHALFKASRFDELPGWSADNMDTAWDAFQSSCQALAKREPWKPLCDQAAALPRNPVQWRQFFEQGFALFRILNADTSHDGEVTGYYEPLINGSPRAQGNYTVPVYATPHDLYTLDWKTIPAAQRGGTVFVVKAGRGLQLVPVAQADSYALNTNAFDLDTRDRSWRVQLVGAQALPYRSRAEIESGTRLDAPVIAYVDDALALYAMQMQGSGRIRLPDGTQLRVQYAEQNGHPFKPLRLVSKGPERGRSRNIAATAVTATTATDAAADAADIFELANDSETAPIDVGDNAAEGVRRRGVKPGQIKPASTQAVTDALVEQLLRQSQGKPETAAASPARAAGSVATAPTPTPQSDSTVRKPPSAVALNSDPSYVFFRIASDQSPTRGPVGALGVPLTAERSIAVDPRVTPLGYPVYISSPTRIGAAPSLQRLVIAQDTGGAIRGAVRADFFWGSGPAAGRLALRTRQAGAMWLLLPHAEAAQLRQRGIGTRLVGGALRLDAECLVADESFCSEPD